MKPLLLAVLLLSANPLLAREPIASRVNLGINLAPLYSGLPELQGDYFFNRFIGVSGSAGYMNKVRRGIVDPDLYVVVTDAEGAYFKLGIKGRLVSPTRNEPVFWTQLLYVYSSYNEHGYYLSDLGSNIEYYHHKGSSNRVVASVGIDCSLRHRLDFRAGFQAIVYYPRDEYFSHMSKYFQPGIGTSPGVLILGLNYRIGKLPLHSAKAESSK